MSLTMALPDFEPSAKGLVPITVWLMSGRCVQVAMRPGEKVAQLQRLLAAELGVRTFQIMLLMGMAPLQPQRPVEELASACVTLAVAAAPLRLYACGGADMRDVATSTVCGFHIEGGECGQLPAMRECRTFPSVVALGPHLYVCGGERGKNGKEVLASVERLDVASGGAAGSRVWEPVAAMPRKSSAATAVALRGSLYVCGGHRGCKTYKQVCRYDPDLDRWSEAPAMLGARGGAGGICVDDRIYLLGGNNGHQALSCGEVFDPDAGRWAPLPRMRERRIGAAVAAAGGHIYVCGGGTGTALLSSVERFSLTSWCWERVAPMLQQRARGLAVTVQGCVLVCGGRSQLELETDHLECFYPGTGSWERAGTVAPMCCESTWASVADHGEAAE